MIYTILFLFFQNIQTPEYSQVFITNVSAFDTKVNIYRNNNLVNHYVLKHNGNLNIENLGDDLTIQCKSLSGCDIIVNTSEPKIHYYQNNQYLYIKFKKYSIFNITLDTSCKV